MSHETNTAIKELKIRIKSPLISVRNGMIVDAHQSLPPGVGDGDPRRIEAIANNVACTISPFTMLGWLRNGATEYLMSLGISPCHGYDLTTVSPSGGRAKNAIEDLERGFHHKRVTKGGEGVREKPECEVVKGEPCLTYRMFGGFASHHRVFSMVAFKTSPIKDHFYKQKHNVTGVGNYRRINVSPRSGDGITPYNTYLYDTLANVDGIQYLQMYESDDVYIGLLIRAIEFLRDHKTEFSHQLGGSRTFGHGFVEPVFLNPLYTRSESVNYVKELRNIEEDFDDDSVDYDNVKRSKHMNEKDEKWGTMQKRILTVLDDELVHQKELFGVEDRWWSTEIKI